MDKIIHLKLRQKKGWINMALLAKPCNAIMMIKADRIAQFEEYSKKNAISSEHLKKCLEISKRINNNGK